MEYTQWDKLINKIKKIKWVLILVVMEYTQWGVFKMKDGKVDPGLNPCCNGIYSMSLAYLESKKEV